MEVPNDAKDQDLEDLIGQFYGEVDCKEYDQDPDFWKAGEACYWEMAGEEEPVSSQYEVKCHDRGQYLEVQKKESEE